MVILVADWVSCPDNNLWTLPDGARIRTTVEGVRHTVRVPQSPWLPSSFTGAHIDLDNLNECVWEYWSEDATEGPSEFVAGFEAAAAEGRWLVRRARLLGWLRVFAFLGIGLGVSSLVASWVGPLALAGSALLSSVAAVVAIVVGSRITRMDREARRG